MTIALLVRRVVVVAEAIAVLRGTGGVWVDGVVWGVEGLQSVDMLGGR